MKKLLLVALIVTIFAILIIFFLPKKNENMIYGVSFNQEYNAYLGFDFKKVFHIILDDWKFRHVRLSAQWNLIEKKQGEMDFADLDWMMDESASRGAKIVLAIGQKTPRWPECHLPDWVEKMEYHERREHLFNFISAVIARYKEHKALEYWQVENEPFLSFGACKPLKQDDLAEEIQFVKAADPFHQIIVTDSGELSSWRKTAKASDIFGTTMYRVVWNKTFGYWSYDWLPSFVYTLKLWLN
ncbi:MAG: beta-galactosidase, partial [Patescibacteria group bacterium]